MEKMVERTGRKTGTRERRRARLGESGARTREGRRERAGRGRWRNGDDPIVRVRSRSPYYDVTNFLCFVFH
jgi:hypothetical protein